jgi:hypothetical protein
MFVVYRESENKTNMESWMHESDLYIYDSSKNEQLAFVKTVYKNKEDFIKRHIRGAETARHLYATLNYPSMKDFEWVIRSNQIKDCPVTVQDIDAALKIWWERIAALKGKRDTIFLGTESQGMLYGGPPPHGQNCSTNLQGVQGDLPEYYLQRGFRITIVHADVEYAPLEPLIRSMPAGPMVNLASANEHVPETEQRIRIVKERSRATRHSLPF